MRLAETWALGSIMDIMMKAKKICIAYCMKAIMSPTCIEACATWWAPTQMMMRETPFMMSIMTGIITTITRFTKSRFPVRSLLALSKRSSSWPCMTSLFVRVMREAVEKVSNSCRENPSTLVKTALRRSREMPDATRAEM